MKISFATRLAAVTLFFFAAGPLLAADKTTWKPVEFAIVRYNDEAPASWNLYHSEKKGILLLRLWKRYLLIDLHEEEAFDIDPQTIKASGDNVEWSLADKPAAPLETAEWKTRDVGPVRRVRIRLRKGGPMLEVQVPLMLNGEPAY